MLIRLATGCYIAQAVLKPTRSRFVHIPLYARLCVCVYVAAFACVHIRPCSVACTMPRYLNTHRGLCTVYICTVAYLWYYFFDLNLYMLKAFGHDINDKT